LSGRLQGAGGIGGLLALTEHATFILQPGTGHSYYHSDGNGNVTCLINTSNVVVAQAAYDPYGNFLSFNGFNARINPYWFSSKPLHCASGKYDYLYRWYTPVLARWPNRDPINEIGFNVLTRRTKPFNLKEEKDLYWFVGNNPIRYWDYLGLNNPGCDPPGDKAIKCFPEKKDCILRCCDEHDKCYYDNGCTFSSWIFESTPECMACNAAAAVCITMCKVGKGPEKGPRWFCPNGPNAGKFYDDYSQMPASCWKDAKKPLTPQPDVDPPKSK
jgi:RHS repeat-associated protein